MTVTADSTLYTADGYYPTADGFVPSVIPAAAVEPANALDQLDAAIGAQVFFATVDEAADAVDELDAAVDAAAVPIGGGRGYPPLRLFPVVGVGYGILPQLVGEAHGVVVVAGDGVGALPGLSGEAAGAAGVAGRSAARLVVRGAAIGTRGQVGAAATVLKGLAVAGAGVAGIRGSGSGTIMKFEGAAVGRHDDDEAAVMAFLLAA